MYTAHPRGLIQPEQMRVEPLRKAKVRLWQYAKIHKLDHQHPHQRKRNDCQQEYQQHYQHAGLAVRLVLRLYIVLILPVQRKILVKEPWRAALCCGRGICACRGGNLLVDNGNGEFEVPNMNKAMLADAIATCTGAALGTSTVTTFVESSAGVAAGGKSGMTSLVTAGMFVLALFLAPLAKLIPAYAYGAALIYVGILMIGSVKDVDWSDVSVAVPAFLTMAMMPFTYNISFGIAFGLISYVVIKTFTGRVKEVKAGTWVITALFLAMFFLTH